MVPQEGDKVTRSRSHRAWLQTGHFEGADRRSSLSLTFSRDMLRTNLILKLSAGTIRLFLLFFFSSKNPELMGKMRIASFKTPLEADFMT